jgi:GWxTD domain-containing protein
MRRVLLTIALLATAATAPAQEQEPIRVWLTADSYAYLDHDSVSYVEFCSAIQRSDIQFEEIEGGFVGKTYLYFEVMDESGTVVDSSGKYLPIAVKFLEEAYRENVRIFDCSGSALPPQRYQVKLTVVDINTKRTGEATCDVEVRDYETDKLELSDIELAYRVEAVEDSSYSPLVKAGRKVIPNPNGYFSSDDSVLFFYAELYNLRTGEGDDEEFEIEIRMQDRYGYELKEFPTLRRRKPGKTAVITESVSLAGLPGGLYILQVQAKDLATGAKTVARERVSIVYSFEQLSPSMSAPDAWTEEDAELMAKVIKYISSKTEKDTYESLDLEGKKNFLARFWEDRNPNPGGRVNNYKNEIFRRFLYANYHFSTSLIDRNDGWRTDRGRIYVKYGEPDEIERHPSSMGTKPYQKWYYDRLAGQSGGDFLVFVDEDGYGDYRLVHATLRGEISNPDWEERLGTLDH